MDNITNFSLNPSSTSKANSMVTPTPRAQAAALRTYHRPISDGSDSLETWDDVIARVISHQQWLWQRTVTLNEEEWKTENDQELEELKNLLLEKRATVAGRTLWLGGTNISKTRESSQFNCSFTNVETIYDVVDILWLLLQGCGVGFRPVVGTLNGFRRPLKDIKVVRSVREGRGSENNEESYDPKSKAWTIKVGDSAEAWAKAAGKLVAGKYPAETLVLDFSEIRPAGYRLRGYGWISSGDQQISEAFVAISKILSDRADQLLTAIDILDICNWLGTILSSRRSAQIALLDSEHPESGEFAAAKKDYWHSGKEHRRQSNNSIVFHHRPEQSEIETFLEKMVSYGGSEPGIVNAETATKRAPWFQGLNPCGEILLGNKSFCNLVEVNLLAFKGNKPGLERALYLMARANYRQTMVFLEDGILQEAWHRQNAFLHLCGVGLTGIAARPDLRPYDYKRFSAIAKHAAYSMAEELDRPLPKNVTTIKPSGTVSKVMSTEEWGEVPEGIHKPLGRFIFNWITYSIHDPLVDLFVEAGYETMEKPNESESILVKFPVRYDNVPFERHTITRNKNGIEVDELIEVNTESAIEQLERYKMLMENWCDHNVSITVSYDPSEIAGIASWLHSNWSYYVAVSFILRNDPTKTAEDLGHPYLPQEVVIESDWIAYSEKLSTIDWKQVHQYDNAIPEACPLGGCPVK